MTAATSHRTVDLRDTRCPANCAEALVILDEEPEGRRVEFLIAADTVLNVPNILRQSGHYILAVSQVDAVTTSILVARGA